MKKTNPERIENMDSSRYRHAFSQLPQLETKRLILKKIAIENSADMYSYSSLESVTKYLLWSPHLNIHETKGYIEYLQREYRKGNYADWGITYKENGVFIGTIGFANIDMDNNSGEIGYVLNPAYHRRGIMTEALERVLEFAFGTLAMHRVQLRIMDGNEASVKLAEKMGFKYEGMLRDSILCKGAYRTVRYYSMIENEYFARYGYPTF